MSDLQELARLIAVCTDCPLSGSRTLAVPGEGSEHTEILFIGEGPGFHEDRQGRPFVGPAGQILNELLSSIGLDRSQVYITNMVKCRPPSNRDPFPGEIEACSKYLDREIGLLNPKIIATLGRHSLAKFFPGESVSKARGRPRLWKGYTVYPIMHPAAALYRRELREVMHRDFEALSVLLKEMQPVSELPEDRPRQLPML